MAKIDRFCLLLLLALLPILHVPLPAQYRVHSWESFETGGIPKELILGHSSGPDTVLPYAYNSPGTPPVMTSGIASLECATTGVLFKPNPKKLHLSIVSPTSLDRRQLGATGKALYQADVFLPAPGQPLPNTALLALVQDPNARGGSYKMYRFGFSEAPAAEAVYFAYANPDLNKTPGAPIVYKHQKLAGFNLKRPGWHRLQMIFVGQEEIFCAIDLQSTSFSPVREKSLSVLNAGIMVASTKGANSVIVDNVSIQWSFENVPLPDSPWLLPMANADAPNENLMESGSSVFWLTDPQKAWKLASAQKRPILAQFYAPRIPTYARLKEITPNDDETKALLNRFVLLKVDVNQLGGGTLAQKFGIVRVPTFMIMGPDGKEMKRVPFAGTQTTWGQLKAELSTATSPTGLDQQADSGH